MAEETITIINHYPEKTAPQDWQQLAERSFLKLRELFDGQNKKEQAGETDGECHLYKAVP